MTFSYNPKNNFYTFYNYEHFADGILAKPDNISFGTFILDLLSLDMDNLLQSFSLCVSEENINISTTSSYNKLLSILSQNNNKRIITLMLDQFLDITSRSNVKMIDIFDSMTFSIKGLQRDLIEYILTGSFEKDSWCEMLDNYSQKIYVSINYDNDSSEIYMQYDVKDIFSLISLDFVNIRGKGIQIKQCKNCGKFFIPSKRSDEIYCDRIYRNDKTCKQIGYEEKAKADPFIQAYTKARKTQHARIRYNSHIENYKEKHYEPWKKAAEKARDEFQKTNDIDGFKKWLDDHKNSF